MKLWKSLLLATLLAACGDNYELGPQVTSSHVSSTVGEDGTVTITIDVADPEGLTFSASAPEHGTLTGSGPTFVYHPAAQFSGHDTFVVTVSDGNKSVDVPVYLVIEAVNDAPVATNDAFATPEDTILEFPVSAILANDSDIDSKQLVVTAVTQPDAMVCASPGCGQPTVSLADDMITYRPPYNFSGDQTFQYTVSDGALTATGTVTISVGAVNDAPIAFPDTAPAREDVAAVIPMADLLANDYDADGDTPMVIAVADAAHGSVAIVGTDVVFTPDAEYSGPASFAYTISDGSEESTSSVAITVAVVDDAPVVADATLATTMNRGASFTLTGTDIDSAALTFAIATQPAHGTISGTSPTFTYTPDTGYFGDDAFTFVANDGTSNSAPATMSVTISEETALIHYTFEGTGTTIPNFGTAGVDGTVASSVEMGGAGVCGQGLRNITPNTPGYVDTNVPLALPSSWTVSFWTQGADGTTFYVFGEPTTQWRIFTNGVAGTGNWIMRGNGITDSYINGGADGALHMVTWVYDASLGTTTGYLDGVAISTVSQPALSLSGGNIRVGTHNGSNGLGPAVLDELRLYDSALDATSVLDLYNTSQVCPL